MTNDQITMTKQKNSSEISKKSKSVVQNPTHLLINWILVIVWLLEIGNL